MVEADGETEARPRNWYEAKQDAKRARLEAASRRAKAEADELSSRAHAMADVIPLGQPILVGHHSEKRDRGYRGRISRTFERAHEAGRKAQALAARAESVGTGGISSDDPEAVTKLKERLADLEAGQALMVAVNREIRKGGPGLQERLIALGLPAMTADRVVMPDFAGRVGVPDYKLKNNGAEIRRIRRRIDELLAAAQQPAREAIEGAGWRITEDRDENRVAVTFDAIPGQEVRDRLKASGFRWSPSRGAWVRQLNNAAWAAARYAMEVK
ncbi:MAG TPA: DUF3560 domain-containing protein [Gemmatimonadales bacterium]|nr:DUF3560 domain-containing protein [Gemmatimonadales bacterium]